MVKARSRNLFAPNFYRAVLGQGVRKGVDRLFVASIYVWLWHFRPDGMGLTFSRPLLTFPPP